MKRVNFIKKGFLTDLSDYRNIYMLGLLWADGSIYEKAKRTAIECKKEDMENNVNFLNYLHDYGVFSYKTRQRFRNDKKFGKEQAAIEFGNTKYNLYHFLADNDYHIKSGTSPDKILSKIPDNLKHYWWRGFFDGDGCLYIKSRNDLSFWSGINQDWTFCEKLKEKLNLNKFYLRKCNYAGHFSSLYTTQSIIDIFKILTYIYPPTTLEIGYKRKFETFTNLILKIKDHSKNKKHNHIISQRYNEALSLVKNYNVSVL